MSVVFSFAGYVVPVFPVIQGLQCFSFASVLALKRLYLHPDSGNAR